MKKYFLFFAVFVMAACTVSNKNDIDKDVKAFLTDFNGKLSQSDEVIWKQFMTLQNKEEIFKVIRILQNKESDDIVTKIDVNAATAEWVEGFLNLTLPILLSTDKSESKSSKLVLSLIKKENGFYVGRVDGNKTFQAFSILKNQIEFADEMRKRIADVRMFYDQAKKLQKNYDSIVWYVNHNYKTYYYAVNGHFSFDSLKSELVPNFKMGLIDSDGKLIVPVEFEVVGNPSVLLDDAVEVKRNGRVGYFSMEGKELIPPIYDWVMPYAQGQAFALVRKDSTYGWLDKDYGFHLDFPTAGAKEVVTEFKYLTSTKLILGRGHQDLINILYPLREGFINEGNGLVVSPAYYVKCGILPLINEGFVTTSDEEGFLQVGNAFEENVNDKPFSLTQSIVALISNFNSRYIGGRGEFYGSHKIILFDKKQNVIGSVLAGGDRDFTFRKISDRLFESSAVFNDEGYGPYGPMEFNFPYQSYFMLDSGKLISLGSNRRYQCTEFVKLDSSYVKRDFFVWNPQSHKADTLKFLSHATITEMRDEILASYGFIFSQPEVKEKFTSAAGEWYKPTIDSYDEIYSKATEIDKHNLDFLNRLIGSTPSSKPI